MIAIRQLHDRVSTAGQLQPSDLHEVAAMGFRVVINNRPDGEAWFGQPPAQKIHEAAAAAGLQSHYLPIVLATLSAADVRAFHDQVRAADGPVLAFCTSGFRCALIWALAGAMFDNASLDDLLAHAARAGHDLSKSRALIEDMLNRSASSIS